MGEKTVCEAEAWWRGAVIYQIYPRSFLDTNGDGVGDLAGVTARLDHVAGLGVDAVWLSPFFVSPMRDFGYDIADYCAVDPVFGTLADFDALVARAQALGLKVIIDQVYAHTSDQHPWFEESRASRENPRADWYVWADPKPDGSPPSNWQSVFGGPAWTWDARRLQYYMHNFLSAQPQLNLHSPAVQEALLAVMQFWLDRGVDGFRLDALNFAMHDPLLRDNPPARDRGPRTRPFDYQQHLFNQSHPDLVLFLERIRALADRHGAIFTVAEVPGADAAAEMKAFTAPGRLSSAYGFDFLYAKALTPKLVRRALEPWIGQGQASWAFANHDAPRVSARWARPDEQDACARAALLLLSCLPGQPILYQGEELGLRQVEIAFEDLKDPEAIANWPRTLSRDGARTPMPWVLGAPQAGFSTAKPWLPVGEANAALAADAQARDPASMLRFTQAALAMRRASAALRFGALRFLDAPEGLLVFERAAPGERVLCAFNLGPDAMAWAPDPAARWRVLLAANGAAPGALARFGGLVMAQDA